MIPLFFLPVVVNKDEFPCQHRSADTRLITEPFSLTLVFLFLAVNPGLSLQSLHFKNTSFVFGGVGWFNDLEGELLTWSVSAEEPPHPGVSEHYNQLDGQRLPAVQHDVLMVMVMFGFSVQSSAVGDLTSPESRPNKTGLLNTGVQC